MVILIIDLNFDLNQVIAWFKSQRSVYGDSFACKKSITNTCTVHLLTYLLTYL